MAREAKILVADDDKDIVESTRIVLVSQGYQVVEAFSGQEALAKVLSEKPDLLVLDVMMEDVAAGFRVVQTVRDRAADSPYAACREVPIIMLTAVQERMKIGFKQDSGTDYLPVSAFVEKPLKVREFLQEIEKALEGS